MNRRERRIHKRKVRRVGIVLASLTLVGATAGLAGPAFAVQGHGERPGYGNGDPINNHDDGPAPKSGENDWPGWAYGDSNHGHEDGPPGQNLG